MTKIIVISSGKGGVGKTTTAINLGVAMKKFGKDVLVVDANMTTPNVGIHLNSPEVPICLNHVLDKKAYLYESVYEHDTGLKIIPSSLSVTELKKLKYDKLKTLKKDLKDLAEIVIIDSAAGLGEEALSAIDMADELVLITNPEMPAITDALKTIKVAEGKKIPIKGVIVSRVKKNKSELEPENVKEMLEVDILGMIPEDIKIQEALKSKNALVHLNPYTKASIAYKEIAAKLLDLEYDSKKDKPNFWRRLFGKK